MNRTIAASASRIDPRAFCLPALAALALVLPAAGAQAACKYQRVGGVPVSWKDQRLVLPGTVNGKPVDMLVDSGVPAVALSHAFAERLGLGLWPVTADGVRMESSGVGGRSDLWRTRVDEISFGKVQWKSAHLEVFGSVSGPAPDVLVGAGFLFQRDAELTADAITFLEASDCSADHSLAYWAEDVPWTTTEPTTARDLRVIVTVRVDGQPVRALVDSGSPTSAIDLSDARQRGFRPEAGADEKVGGIGTHTVGRWPATFKTFEIGDEVIRNPRLEVVDMFGAYRQDFQYTTTEKAIADEPHMLLGADFLKSHRVLFATSQRRMYFSYVGGPVFGAPAVPAAPAAVGSASASAKN